MTDTSRPGSRISAATMDSSRARLTGFLPWACDTTTVSRLLIGALSHVPLEDALRRLPTGIQELIILRHRHRLPRVAVHVEQPARPVIIDVDARRITQQFRVELYQGAGDRGKQIRLGLAGFN